MAPSTMSSIPWVPPSGPNAPSSTPRRHHVDNVKQQTSLAGKIPSAAAQSPNAMGVQTASAPDAQEKNGKTGPLGVEPNPK
ncbi:hypothetical protein LTR28_006759 [Elasticomyces elasticus]|nr:hypothetical protein LTR28_006759 [Elasticomyces elasticus]